ncbi:MAG TPA: DUF502 domain-containing protein, partial [Thermoanaerobaculia bacterium]
MNWLLKNFLRGLVIVVPIALTVYIVYQTFLALDRLLAPWVETPGLGIAIILAAIVVIGALASNFVIRRTLGVTEMIFTRAPIVRII